MKKSCALPRSDGRTSNPASGWPFSKSVTLVMVVALALGAVSPALAGGRKEATDSSLTSSLDLIRSVLTRADSDRCPMTPSCSAYARQAFRRHGALMGWIMTCDRLLRCGRDEKRLAPHIRINGRIFIYDPIENNDFWWSGKK